MAGHGKRLKDVLVTESTLRSWVHAGTGALLSEHKKTIAEPERQRVGDSLDLDEATKAEFPQANRWDYILSLPDVSKLVGVEPHSSTDSDISVVIKKRKHAVTYLAGHLPPGKRISNWFWVTSAVKFSKMEKARKILDQNGITFCGKFIKSLG